jgi:hypothetical protein
MTIDLDEARSRYSAASAKASDVARQLAFAGVAIVWLFNGTALGDYGLRLASDLRWPGALLVLSLLLDFLHAAYQAALWGVVHRTNEKAGKTRNIDVSVFALWPVVGLFWAKLVLLGAGYVLLASYFVQRAL